MMDQPTSPPEPQDFCAVCGCGCYGGLCRECRLDISKLEHSDHD